MSAEYVHVARILAKAAHAGQVDKGGAPYVGHPERVAAMVSGDEATAAGLLHDVLEDTVLEPQDLYDAGIPPAVVAAVELLTRGDGQTPEQYYERLSRNKLALRVKLADISDNLDPDRMAELDQPTRERLVKKYAKARDALMPAIIRWL